jgi:hypothetical protein
MEGAASQPPHPLVRYKLHNGHEDEPEFYGDKVLEVRKFHESVSSTQLDSMDIWCTL